MVSTRFQVLQGGPRFLSNSQSSQVVKATSHRNTTPVKLAPASSKAFKITCLHDLLWEKAQEMEEGLD